MLDDGRTILWSIAQDGRSPDAQRRGGWAHNAGLPLELSVSSGRLAIRPVSERETLRTGPAMVEAYLGDHTSLTTRIDVTAGPPELTVSAGPRTRIDSCHGWRLAATDR